MTTKQFNQEVKKIFNKYQINSNNLLNIIRAEKVLTIFGNMSFGLEYDNKLKLATIFSNFSNNDGIDYVETKNKIKEITGYEFGDTLKNNYFFKDPDECLSFFEEYLNNMLWAGQDEVRQKELTNLLHNN